MVFQIVVAGESQCEKFAQTCLIADHLAQNLPNFCYRRIEKPVLEWKTWLCKINQKNNWHHVGSLLIWKELLMDGSKPIYIGGAPEFFEYCYSYYKFDSFHASERFEDLVNNFAQLQRKNKRDVQYKKQLDLKFDEDDNSFRNNFTVCISGANHPLAMHLISGLLDMSHGNNKLAKIYIHGKEDSLPFLEFVERECSYVGTQNPSKVIKCVEKIGNALTTSDLLIILDHVPFSPDIAIGRWLYKNKKIMEDLAFMINVSASPKMCILLPNLGPACYNATILSKAVSNIKESNIVVATSDLGLGIAPVAAKIAEVPMRNMFCPPVWGFVGINHLVDIRTTIHRYNTFDPYNRFAKVRNSTLCIGTLTPEMRTMEYLMYFDKSLWINVADKNRLSTRHDINKAEALLNVIRMWFINSNPNNITCLGIHCNGAFGLSFQGVFSQPVHFVKGKWQPAINYLMPKDSHITIHYLEKIAELTMSLEKYDLPANFTSE